MREWKEIFRILKKKNHQPRIIYPAKLSFKYEGEIKAFPDEQKVKELATARTPLQDTFKAALWPGAKRQKYRKRWVRWLTNTLLTNSLLTQE